ncbi:MAG: AsmA-like C-terminal region-containing protein, partial [Candidatus Krumholzibacteria bacterium]|nr:AsmA-like C-terminal region-containing protein [Candidatus Krumholzibacteria bacterium]
ALSRRRPGLDLPLLAGGEVRFSAERIFSDSIRVDAGRSRIVVSFDVPLEGEPKKPGVIGFAADARVDIGEAAAAAAPAAPAPAGILEAQVRGSGRAETLMGLFPAGEAADAASIRKAWADIDLGGEVRAAGLELQAAGSPLRLSRASAAAKLSGGDVTGVDASFLLGGSPWKATGDLRGIMPALAELSLLARGDGRPKTPGEALERLTASPDVSLSVTGRSFNAIPLQEASAERKAGAAPAATGAGGPEANPLAGNPATLLLLKKTFVSVRVDSVIATGAVLTDIDARARLSDGILRADPVTMRYAGGSGSGTVKADLRDPSRIPAEIDIDFKGVQADQALPGRHGAAGMVSGEFSLSIGGRFESGPGIDFLESLTAAGSAASTNGQVDLSRFTEPLKAAGIALPFAERFSFDEWVEKFTVGGGRVAADLWQIRSDSGNWDISGSFGFDGTIDYRAKLLLTPAMQSRMKDLGQYRDLVDLFRDEAGNLVFEFDIGGTARSPKMQLDQTKAQQKAGENLIEGARKKLLDLLKKK